MGINDLFNFCFFKFSSISLISTNFINLLSSKEIKQLFLLSTNKLLRLLSNLKIEISFSLEC